MAKPFKAVDSVMTSMTAAASTAKFRRRAGRAGMEYLVAEVLELAGNAARYNKKSSTTPRLLQLAIRNDKELSKLLNGVTITQGGVLPKIQTVLLPNKTDKVI